MSYNQIGILIGICAIAFFGFTLKKVVTPYLRSIWRSGILVFTLYAALLIYIEIHWQFISDYASKFDLNGNGFVDMNEYSEEAIKAMNKKTYGTNVRIYAPLTMAALASIIGFAYLVSDVAVIRLKNKELNKSI
ncbi:hypothetical protein [Flagellimonas zhangzhouensis]|uniref:EF-hand domain-containing protein n=1 Tax=Flagellimonas zhangzhouensis TaxID=1073328 RepID=A0A1H2Q3M0_9FLAO|nr:hypothetical protein [Allomuricauda zhangzhouensis]SDQ47745.1 hypothetical protein SAMN05216294_1396 [Allomuricauda zhangzhouensis]SDW01766.1 hypothetical protein SAMN04487892_0047 [Allomuricauda zhangzhouensis]